MIHKIYCNDKRFKSVSFGKGFNIILADRKKESKEKDSRNGLGKSTFIHIIHFLFGAKLDDNILPIDYIKDWIFYIDIDLCGSKITASRAIENNNIIKFEGNTNDLPVQPEIDSKEGFAFYNIEEWKKLLGLCLYELPVPSRKKYFPSFRSLISYSVRRGVDAYTDSFRYFRSQPTWSLQIHNAFLLGLNWIDAAEVQDIKDKKNAITALESALKTGIVQSKGELEAKRVNIEKEIKVQDKSLRDFKVHPQYKEFQEKANILSTQIHDLSNSIFMLTKKLQRYEDSIIDEQPPDNSLVEKLYSDAGIHFTDMMKKTLQEAKIFHTKIIQNRKNFLKVEIEEIKNEISKNDLELRSFIDQRANLMEILNTHGALEEFSHLQKLLLEKQNELNLIKSKLIEMKSIAENKKQIKQEKIELENKLLRDYEEKRYSWEEAFSIFNENTNALYNESGSLIIDVDENGYSFNIEIPRSSSEGVGKMKIFSYDLMLVEILSRQNKIDFLIHDSSIFDGVDSRQRARAFELANRKASKNGFQYICLINSDMIPGDDLSKDLVINDHVRLTLADQDPGESLMGFRYNEKC